MSAVVATPVRAARASRFRLLLETEALVLLVVAGAIATFGAVLPEMLVGDTWLALVDGRWIADHGLPHEDSFALLTQGREWVDQQWLAHWLLYEAMSVGGVKLLLALVVLFYAVSSAGVALFARSLGASTRSTALAGLAPLIVGPWLLQARTQSVAVPLFVGVYALLARDSRAPSRAVWLVLPLLALWANLHGTAILGAGLVVLHGLQTARRRWRRGLLLCALAPSMLVVSPYGIGMGHYYRLMLLDSPLKDYVSEWHPTSLSITTGAFFAAALGSVVLLGAAARAISPFERAALLVLAVAGLVAVRNTGWLGWGFAMTAPALLDAVWSPRGELPQRIRKANLVVSGFAVALAALSLGTGFSQSSSSLLASWSPEGARRVAAAAGPAGLVLADDVHSDWLVWEEPSLAGRIAYDIRFELLKPRELATLLRFRSGVDREQTLRGYRVLTLDDPMRTARYRSLGTTIYSDDDFAAIRVRDSIAQGVNTTFSASPRR